MNPMTVNVFSQHVYVSDFEKRTTIVYSTVGHNMGTYGFCGDVSVDPDGHLYVCDFYSGYLFCF